MRISMIGALLGGASLILPAQMARAQETDRKPAEQAAGQSVESADIVVTGSRIVRDGFDAPTPVTVANVSDLLNATPQSVQESLYKLPQFKMSGGPAKSNHNQVVSGGNHGYVLNLRGIGGNRTLIMMDGMRLAPTYYNGTVDVSVIPNMLLDRVDIVTGGASAAYGSDAVAGVVNFITRSKFEGLRGVAQSGISQRGDNAHYRLGAAGGFSFGGGAGHVLLSAEHYASRGMKRSDRAESLAGYIIAGSNPACTPFSGACAPGTANNPYQIISNARITGATDLGKIVRGVAGHTDYVFNPDGTIRPFRRGEATGSSGFEIGGDGYIIPAATSAVAPQKSYHGFGRVSYDIAPDTEIFGQLLFSRSDLRYNSFSNSWTGTTLAPIYSDNAYLHPSVRALMSPTDVMYVAHQNVSGPLLKTRERTDYIATSVGGKGTLSDSWSWSASYNFGSSNHKVVQDGNYDWQKAYASVDAVIDPSSGQIVCRASIHPDAAIRQRYADCRPINVLGVDPSKATPEGYAYATGSPSYRARIDQHAFQAVVDGDLFTLPGGPLSVAIGGEWRKQKLKLTSNSDPSLLDNFPAGERAAYFAGLRGVDSSALFYWVTNVGTGDGSVNVKEAFAEVNAPLLSDLPLIHKLDLNGAIRLTDYSTSGSVTTWKLGAIWRPIEHIMLRGTISRDIRAPSLFDLFAGPQTNIGSVFDPVTGLNQNMLQIVGGNPSLQPEVSKTKTMGVVFSGIVDGFELSVDYYDISISKAIGSLTAAQILRNCYDLGTGTPECALIDRPTPEGFPTAVRRTPANIAFIKTAGIDLDMNYRPDVGAGELSLRAYLNYQSKYKTQQYAGAPVLNYNGIATPITAPEARPKWSGALNISYALNGWGIHLAEQYIGKLKLALPGAPSNFAFDNRIKAVWYTDLTLNREISAGNNKLDVFFTVNNLFDKKPPLVPPGGPGANYPTANILYDIVGRSFIAGVRFNM